MYVQYFQQSIDQPGIVPNPARGHPAEEMMFSLPQFASEILGSRDGFGRPFPLCVYATFPLAWVASIPASVRSFSTLRLNLELTHEIPAAFRENTVNRH